MLGKIRDDDLKGGYKADGDELDDRARYQLKVVLQFLQEKELIEALVALESETGVKYCDGDLPVAGILQSSLDMFSRTSAPEAEVDADSKAAEEALQALSGGACCTGPCEDLSGPEPYSANVTAVCWAGAGLSDLRVIVATVDRRLRLLAGEAVVEYSDLSSPPLGLAAAGEELLVTTMGGETQRLRLALQNGAWEFQRLQSFKDHQKQVTCIRFSPDGQHFVTISRDRVANFYRRGNSEVASGDFELLGTRTMAGEVTAVCWLDKTTSVLAARDDHELHYFEMGQKVEESLRVNLNALGDKVVSFTVLALSASKDGSMVAACTDRARVIVLQARSSRQLRNLYGAAVNEYDVPNICFSLDDCFLYVTSSLPQPSGAREQEEVVALCGQVAIFELRTAQLVLQLPCHQKAVRCFDRHPFTEMLVTGSFDKTVKFWS